MKAEVFGVRKIVLNKKPEKRAVLMPEGQMGDQCPDRRQASSRVLRISIVPPKPQEKAK